VNGNAIKRRHESKTKESKECSVAIIICLIDFLWHVRCFSFGQGGNNDETKKKSNDRL